MHRNQPQLRITTLKISRATLIATLLVSALPVASHAQAANSFVVSTNWLAAHLGNPSVVVIDVGMWSDTGVDKAYAEGHIPGTRVVEFSSLAIGRDGLDEELPGVDQIRDVLESAGISDSTLVVVYGSDAPAASRALFTLDYIGHHNFAFLDGGIAKWRAEGRPLSRDVPTFTRGHITPHPNPALVVNSDWITAHASDHNIALIDTRTDGEYLGTGDRHGMPSEGHIAGARQLQWQQLFESDDMTLKSDAALKKLYADRVGPGDTVVTYCWVGYRASMTYFVARYLGYPVKLYDGSYQDWQKRKLPVRAGATP